MSEKKLKVAGANNVIMPERVGGAHMATLVANPDLVEFLDRLSVHGDEPTNLEEIVCENSSKDFNISIREFGIRSKTGANIIGLKTSEGEFILNPSAEIRVNNGTKLFVLGTPNQIKSMKEIISGELPG
jgi:voltage-gated potassium channel